MTIDGKDPHADVFAKTLFPSAKECRKCHQKIYEEWAGSAHAYSAISPMFNKFEQTITDLTKGTIGYFCMRCHAPVATTMGLRRDQAIWDGPRVFREGVTCVACHRVKTPYTKVNGERRMEPGDIHAPVYGAGTGTGVEIAKKYSSFFKIKTDANGSGPGQPIHSRAIQFEELSKSTFCASCHQVGFRKQSDFRSNRNAVGRQLLMRERAPTGSYPAKANGAGQRVTLGRGGGFGCDFHRCDLE